VVPAPRRTIHWFQHVPFEGLGTIERWLTARGCRPSVTRFHAGDPLPAINAIDWLIVMGGPMGVNDQDRYLWLKDEITCIGKAIASGKTVLGICLGAQLIASALGARVYPNGQKEIGWFPVTLTERGRRSPLLKGFPPEWSAFHWHGDTFDLPPGSEPLIASVACPHQAFSHGDRVIGLQCHLEVTPVGVAALIEHCGHELVPAPYIQPAGQLQAPSDRFDVINRRMDSLLDHLWETMA
jgi:GMP synthase-like glutamine amidotransferase